jgi:hypothetical protein
MGLMITKIWFRESRNRGQFKGTSWVCWICLSFSNVFDQDQPKDSRIFARGGLHLQGPSLG